RMDNFLLFSLIATDEAVSDSGLDFSREDPYRIGSIIGSGRGGIKIWEDDHIRFSLGGPRKISAFTIPYMLTDMASGLVAMKYGINGPNFCTTSACSSAGHAISTALMIMQRGDADIMITGGSEASITALTTSLFHNMGALSTRDCPPEEASCPFDARRDGFVIGEGAGILILEELEHAKQRGAKIYAELAGFGQTNDAHHITLPDPTAEPAIKCMEFALRDAEVAPSKVSLINAHGTSTGPNDKGETMAIKKVFGDLAGNIPVQSTKSMIGHSLGASGALEAIAVIKSINTGMIHPTINQQEADPDCDLDYVPNEARDAKVDVAISNSFGFGGHNVCLVFKRFTR
ncbi:beta-ketoacyl-ACP synthase II, partial [Patescibacteria group bacterium]|nr:beta-ketoacyl-ACP synthase II [Patescibacteria group bacterium]